MDSQAYAYNTYAVAAIDGITDHDERDRAYTKARAEAVGGMSLRDYFAAKAMQGLIAGGSTDRHQIAQAAYIVSDAMINARKPAP